MKIKRRKYITDYDVYKNEMSSDRRKSSIAVVDMEEKDEKTHTTEHMHRKTLPNGVMELFKHFWIEFVSKYR